MSCRLAEKTPNNMAFVTVEPADLIGHHDAEFESAYTWCGRVAVRVPIGAGFAAEVPVFA